MPFKKYFSSASPRAGLLAISIIVFAGCASKSGATGKNYTMGQAATAGALTYSVMESEWKESLEGAMAQRLPKHRFLLLHVSIANQGATEASVPFLTLIDSKGSEFREEDKGEGVSPWLGYLRSVKQSETLSGRILFDVPPGGYQLRISSGGEAALETTALVEIPYNADAPPVKSEDPMTVPPAK